MNEITLRHIAARASAEPIYNNPNFPPSLYYRFLKLLAQEIPSALSVELGVSGGGGSLHMAMTSKLVVGVDTDYEPHKENISHITKNFPNFIFFNGDSVGLAQQVAGFGEIDLLFIDTTHTYAQTMAEYNAYEPFLSNKSVVCLDDLFRDGMVDAFSEIPGNKIRMDWLHPSQSPTDGGFGIIWK